MPSLAQHKMKYQHNKSFLNEFNNQKYIDWAIVVDFYCVVHIIEAYLASKGTGCYNHKTRRKFVSQELVLKKYYNEYDAIYSLSKKARYDGVKLKSSNLALANSILSQFEKNILSMLKA